MNAVVRARSKSLNIGDTLPNGATLIDYTIEEFDDTDEGMYRYGKCLALFRSSADKYVTWNLVIRPTDEILTINGHYFDRLRPALEDFECRR